MSKYSLLREYVKSNGKGLMKLIFDAIGDILDHSLTRIYSMRNAPSAISAGSELMHTVYIPMHIYTRFTA